MKDFSWPITLTIQLETATKRSSPNVNVTPTTSTMMSLVQDFSGRLSRVLNILCDSTYLTTMFPSGETCISCSLNRAKTAASECANTDANQEKLIQIVL